MTGAIDDQVRRNLNDRYEYLKNLEKRKEEVAKAITEQEKMTDEIQSAIDAAQTMTEVEDIYRPFKQKKKTRASVAIEKGLQPLADFILAQAGDPYAEAEKYIDEEKKVSTVSDAIAGQRRAEKETPHAFGKPRRNAGQACEGRRKGNIRHVRGLFRNYSRNQKSQNTCD